MKTNRCRHSAHQGFVLVVVLWSIAALTLIVGGITLRINATLEQSYRLNEVAKRERQQMATEQTLLYLLSTRSWNPAGARLVEGSTADDEPTLPFEVPASSQSGTTLRFDGTVYPGIGEIEFAIQDAGALFDISEPSAARWQRATRMLGVSPADADRWLDQLQDYQDLDELPRLNGAERPHYQEAGLTAPPNRFMISPHELRNLPIAARLPEATARLIPLATTWPGAQANINTSPGAILQWTHDLSDEDTRRVLDRRRQQPIATFEQASQRFGVIFQGNQFNTAWQPSDRVRIMLGAQGRQRRWIAVTFTPNADGHPWAVEYAHPVSYRFHQEEPNSAHDGQFSVNRSTSPPDSDSRAGLAARWADYSAFFPAQLPMD